MEEEQGAGGRRVFQFGARCDLYCAGCGVWVGGVAVGFGGAETQGDFVAAFGVWTYFQWVDLGCVGHSSARATSRGFPAELSADHRRGRRRARGVDGASWRISERREWAGLGRHLERLPEFDVGGRGADQDLDVIFL